MKKPVANQDLLQLLVSVYNKSIQTYHHFPEVILCGGHRLTEEEFHLLLENNYVTVASADSFGKNYCLSRAGQEFIFHALFRRKSRHWLAKGEDQKQLAFEEMV